MSLLLKEALELLLQNTSQIEECEMVSLWDGVNRVLAEDVIADHDQPPFPRSPLDGYACFSGDLTDASVDHPVSLRVIDEVCAGHVTGKTVAAGTAVRIMTGAPIPDGADCVIRQEDTDYGETRVEIRKSVNAYDNYCFAGEDYRAGTVLLKKGCILHPVELGILASLGRTEVPVLRKVRTAVFSTGDEIVMPGTPLMPGKIYDSNLYTTVLQLKSFGTEVTDRDNLADDAEAAADRIRLAFQKADLIVTTGGVSVGKMDIMHEVIRLLGAEQLFWKIAIKPGMPTLAARYQGKLLICLSGNPFGAVVNTELLIRPVIAAMSGRTDLEPVRKNAVLMNAYGKKSKTVRYVRAFCQDNKVWMADGSNDSGVLSTMYGCNCLVEIPAGSDGIKAGACVDVVVI